MMRKKSHPSLFLFTQFLLPLLFPIVALSFVQPISFRGPQICLNRLSSDSEPAISLGCKNIPTIKQQNKLNSLFNREPVLYATLQTDRSKQVSQFAQEFRTMMSEFELFTTREIESVSNPRYRTMYYGVKAGATEPKVFKAFEVLYEDMVPIRLAGRMIFKRLRQVLLKSVERRNQEEENIAKVTGLEQGEIDGGRRAFMAIKAEKEDFLTLDQLVESGIVHTIVELSESQTFDEFMVQLKVDKRGRLTFENFMIGLQQCAADSESPNCKLSSVLQEVEKMMGPIEATNNLESVEKRKKKHSKQFDKMLETFKLWEDKTPVGEGRMLEVLHGCFDGAKNPAIVEALRIVYIDYSALRVAGDLVFKLVSRVIG